MLEVPVVFLAVAAVLASGQLEHPRLVNHDSGCGFRIGVPAAWKVQRVKSSRKGECEIHLVPPERERLPGNQGADVYAIRVRSTVGDERTACEQYRVCKDDRGRWYFAGPGGGGMPASARHVGSSLVVEGGRETHIYSENGRATIDALDAMLIGKDRVVEVDANNGDALEFFDQVLFTAIVRSLRFRERDGAAQQRDAADGRRR